MRRGARTPPAYLFNNNNNNNTNHDDMYDDEKSKENPERFQDVEILRWDQHQARNPPFTLNMNALRIRTAVAMIS